MAFQLWVDEIAGSPAPGTVIGVLAGDLLKEAGLVPPEGLNVADRAVVVAPTPAPATRLTVHDAFDSRPDWSPDGRRIAFNSNRDGKLGGLRDERRRLRRHPPHRQRRCTIQLPLVARRPAHRVHSTRDGNWEIYVMNADGSGVTRLTYNDAYDGCLPPGRPTAGASRSTPTATGTGRST